MGELWKKTAERI